MRRIGAAVVALVAFACWPSAAAWGAGCAPEIEDPTGVLAASSRLSGAVAALGRLDVGVTIVVAGDAQSPVLSAASCSAPTSRRAGTVIVDLHGQPLSVSVQGSGSVSQQLARQAQRAIRTRLHATPTDTSSAVAHGLELVWQEQDQRGGEVSPRRQEGADAAPETVRTLPSVATVNLVKQMMLVVAGLVAAGVVVAAAVLAGARLVGRRRLLYHLRARAQACRTDLAERYVDLDARLATIVTTIDQCAARMDGEAARRVQHVAGQRKAAVEAAALQAGAGLLACPGDLQHVSAAAATEVADRCARALAQLEDTILLLSNSAIDAADQLRGRRRMPAICSLPSYDDALT